MLNILRKCLRRLCQRANIVANLTVENMALRQQIMVLKRNRKRPVFHNGGRILEDRCALQTWVKTGFLGLAGGGDDPVHDPIGPKAAKTMCPQCALKIDHKTVKNRGRVVGHGGFLSSFYV